MTQTILWGVGCGAFLSPKITFFLQLFSDFFSCLEFIEINNNNIKATTFTYDEMKLFE